MQVSGIQVCSLPARLRRWGVVAVQTGPVSGRNWLPREGRVLNALGRAPPASSAFPSLFSSTATSSSPYKKLILAS